MKREIPNFDDVIQSYKRIKNYIHFTPVITSKSLNKMAGCELFFKCENFQKTGSFKLRGAINSLKSIKNPRLLSSVATHSSGKHGAALAYAAKKMNIPAFVIMPENSLKVKIDAVKNYGGKITFCGIKNKDREDTLKNILNKNKSKEIPPYDDFKIISGQGTVILELCNKVPGLDSIVAPVGGGGLLSGCSIALQYKWPNIKIFGAEPLNVNDAQKSLDLGYQVIPETKFTIADGLRTPLGNINFEIIKKHVSKIFTASEIEIIKAMKIIWERMKIIVEPSCAIALAVIFNNKSFFNGKKIGIILSGGNIDLNSLKNIL